MDIKIKIGSNTPTEVAVMNLFCHETIIDNGERYAVRWIHEEAVKWVHRYIKARRSYKKYPCIEYN